MPAARRARTPPTPSSSSWRMRMRWSPKYRRAASWRFSSELPSTSVSSRNSLLRPTAISQTWARNVSRDSGTSTTIGWPAGVDGAPGARPAQIVAQLTEGAVDPGAQRGVARQVVEALRGKPGQHRDRIVVRRPERFGIEVAEQFYDVRVPGPPQVARQL